jgi:hypothetical protein
MAILSARVCTNDERGTEQINIRVVASIERAMTQCRRLRSVISALLRRNNYALCFSYNPHQRIENTMIKRP